MDEFTFHILSLLAQSGMLVVMVSGLWKMAGIVQDFKTTKVKLEDHIEDDKEQLHILNTSVSYVQQGVARIEGQIKGLNGHK